MNYIAQTTRPFSEASGEAVGDVVTIKGLENIFQNVILVSVGFAGLALFVILMIGGYNYITSQDDPKKLQAAQDTLKYALLGITLLALSYLILRTIAYFTGASDILIFDIYRE